MAPLLRSSSSSPSSPSSPSSTSLPPTSSTSAASVTDRTGAGGSGGDGTGCRREVQDRRSSVETARAGGGAASPRHGSDRECTRLQRTLRRLTREYKAGKKEHRRQLQQQLEEQNREALLAARRATTKAREAKKRDEKRLRKKWQGRNANLRTDLRGKEGERDALQRNIQLMGHANEEARAAVSLAKTACIKSTVRHSRLLCEVATALGEADAKELHRTSLRNRLDAEEATRRVYLTAMEGLVKLVQKSLSLDDEEGSKLKADVTRVARRYISTESRRRSKSYLTVAPHQQEGAVPNLDESFQSVTSATERCEEEEW